MSTLTRVYAGRLAGLQVRGPDFEVIGRVRDVVIALRAYPRDSRAVGLVVELTTKQRIFLPMLRIAAIEPGDITLVSGQVSMRQFRPRVGEQTVIGDIIGTRVHTDDPDEPQLHGSAVEIADIELERTRTRDWVISRVAVIGKRGTFGRTSELNIVDWRHVHGLSAPAQAADSSMVETIAALDDMRPADVASYINELTDAERNKLAYQLNDERLADIVAELPEDDQAEMIEALDIERAADILEEMDPDDAADILQDLDESKAEVLLELMDPDESAPVRRMMGFSEDTVGALMTPEPVILSPQTTVAEALAHVRNPDLPVSLSSLIFVTRAPTATPTGSYLGCIHLQRLLREPPSMLIGGILDPELPALRVDDDHATAARYFATYNLVCGPVLDENNHLLGAVAVDDLLDHLLPENWREDGIRPDDPTPRPFPPARRRREVKRRG
ncbi:magnesium transporter MgtE N-terminal domain-containing protein [Corynebacterium guangdongense]|uniref:Mg/Co/Ni transporter MgtE n=1 Tax=Corynebacterium guangdongense TaxID=1783348 RepID=A0ABU1ZVT8_9CORY|nr:CBS domain-containing protein [Corynebacterium guangdongense]MDR7329044.1 Mg/Co/Ni transporter MgtE [Corynebacterium guangdongense]WJZ17614.1 Magnesium transporter MgtE [Corynebacterium guangdongense]